MTYKEQQYADCLVAHTSLLDQNPLLAMHFPALHIIQMQQQLDIDEIKEAFGDSVVQPAPRENIEIPKSQVVGQYSQFFEGLEAQAWLKKSQSIDAIVAAGIYYNSEDQFQDNLELKIANHSANFEIVELQLSLGRFTFKNVAVVSIPSDFPINTVCCEGSGAYGKVYKTMFQKEVLALKVTPFPTEENSNKIDETEVGPRLKLFLKQYCLAKIASILKIGPQVCGQLGFDLLMYRNCVAYAMEYCQDPHIANRSALLAANLREKVLSLHAIGLVHMDIKLENVCFSARLNQFVLIDYGLSKFIPERFGQKSYTTFYGTITYCCQQMSDLLPQMKSGLLDLYYNDMVCLKNTFQVWKECQGREDFNANSAFDHPSCDFESSLMVYYMKFLAHRLKLAELQLCIHKNLSQLKSLELHELVQFIKRMSFTSDAFFILLEIFKKTKSVQRNDDRTLSNFQECYDRVFRHLKGLNEIEIQRRQDMAIKVKGKQLLLNWEAAVKQNWAGYLRMLAKYIQINSNIATLEQKLKFSKVARTLLSKNYIPGLADIEKQVAMCLPRRQFNDLEYFSRILFYYCLRGDTSDLKIAIFHAIIYNVIILELFPLQLILQFYCELQHLELDFAQKMRMLLRFKTTFFWKRYEINLPGVEFISIIEKLSALESCYEEEVRQGLSDHQRALLKLANFKFIWKQDRINLKLAEDAYENLSKTGESLSVVLNQDFNKQLKIWVICSLIEVKNSVELMKELETLIFKNRNSQEIVFEYYHLLVITNFSNFSFGGHYEQKEWAIARFYNIFSSKTLNERYGIPAAEAITCFKKAYHVKTKQFLKTLKEKVDISAVNPSSYFGKILYKQLHKILIKNKITQFPPDLRNIYLENQKFLLYYHLDSPLSEKQFLFNIFNMIKEQFYMSNIYSWSNTDSRFLTKFRQVYLQCKQSVAKISNKKVMNYSLLALNLMIAYLMFRKRQFGRVSTLMPTIISLAEILDQQQDVYIRLREDVITFCFKLIFTRFLKTSRRRQQISFVYNKFYDLIVEKQLYLKCLAQQVLFVEICYYLIFLKVEKMAHFINHISRCVIQKNSRKASLQYFAMIQWLQAHPRLYQCNRQLVLQGLEPVEENPYNTLYLHNSMFFNDLRKVKYVLQITKGLALIDRQVVSLILPRYHNYFIQLYVNSIKNRKIKQFFRKSLKFNNNQLNCSRILIMISSETALYRWSAPILATKYAKIKEKIWRFYSPLKSETIESLSPQGNYLLQP